MPIHVTGTHVTAAAEPQRFPGSDKSELEIALIGGYRGFKRGDAGRAALRVALHMLIR